MFYFTKWDVLVIDDEPDVLTLSRLTLGDLEVYGLPLGLHMARTKAEATQLLEETPDLATNLALAFVDVVMESDVAGLELCRYIREEIGNRNTQIFIRTGQPGLAPEKEVIDHYEINGYVIKMEATEEKLYMLVKSGVRQFLWSIMAQTYLAGFNEVLNSLYWRQKIEQLLRSYVESTPGVSSDIPLYVAFDDKVLIQQNMEQKQITRWRQTLDGAKGMRFALNGSQYVRDEENRWGIHIKSSPTNAEVVILCHTAFAPPDDLVVMTHDFYQGLATLWQRVQPPLGGHTQGKDP